jgi:hypothetical protein
VLSRLYPSATAALAVSAAAPASDASAPVNQPLAGSC